MFYLAGQGHIVGILSCRSRAYCWYFILQVKGILLVFYLAGQGHIVDILSSLFGIEYEYVGAATSFLAKVSNW